MTTTSITSPIEKRAYSDAAAIATAKAGLETAKKVRLAAEKQVSAAVDSEHEAAGRVAVAIAKAIEHGADPALVLPLNMQNSQRSMPRIITSAAELTVKRITNSLSITGSPFPGWMEIIVGELFVHYMPTPLWMEWETKDRARREAARSSAA
jgi:hypothetical protein